MKYAALIYSDPAAWADLTPEQISQTRAEVMPQWNELFEFLGRTGRLVSGSELDDPPKARTVRVRNGEVLVTDGPYAETKEQLGGVMILECNDLDEAIESAARIPSARRGSIEVRPLVER